MYKCQACKAEFEKIPTVHAGDETLNRCTECNTTEGEWVEVDEDDTPSGYDPKAEAWAKKYWCQCGTDLMKHPECPKCGRPVFND